MAPVPARGLTIRSRVTAEFLEEIPAHRVPSRVARQGPAEQPGGDPGRRPSHYDGSFNRCSTPRVIRRSTSRAARNAAMPAGVTA